MDSLPHHNNPRRKAKGTGRRKIEMQKIENESNLQVTFSKRRAGLFKKASELDTLCGTQSVVVASSPSEKAHSYGNPDVETIADMFLNPNEGYSHQTLATRDSGVARRRNQKVTDMERELEVEKKYKKELNDMRKMNRGQYGAPPNLDELTYHELEGLKRSVVGFKQSFENMVRNPMGSSNPHAPGTNPSVGFEGNFSTGGTYVGFPSGLNIQGSFSNYQTLFNEGPDNVESSYPSETFFSDVMNANTGYVCPLFDNLGTSFQYNHDVARVLNLVEGSFDEEEVRADVVEDEKLYTSWGTQG